MRLHEYQAKALFQSHGIPVPRHELAQTPLQVKQAAERLIADTVVVKAQVQSDGRTRAGGIKVVDTPHEAQDYAEAMLGSSLITESSGPEGKLINALLVEETCEVATELYLCLHTDPLTLHTIITASREQSDESDRLERQRSGRTSQLCINPRAGIQDFQCRQLSQGLKLSVSLADQFAALLKSLARLFVEKYLKQIEIKPLVITAQGRLVCLDGTIVLQTQPPRHPKELQALRDKSQQSTPELPHRPRRPRAAPPGRTTLSH